MENLTIGELAKFLGFFIGLGTMIITIKTAITKTISKTLEPINQKIDNLDNKLNKKINNFELSNIKTDLVNFMSDAENENITKEQLINGYEMYDKYKKLGGNSYIHDKWEKLKRGGKI